MQLYISIPVADTSYQNFTYIAT